MGSWYARRANSKSIDRISAGRQLNSGDPICRFMYGRVAILLRQVGLAECFFAERRRRYWTGVMSGMSRGVSIEAIGRGVIGQNEAMLVGSIGRVRRFL